MANKFVTTIAGSAEGIKLKRAQNTATAAQLAQENLINVLRGNVQGIEAQLTQHLDIGPDSGDSLRPVAKNFDAASWVRGVQDLRVSQKKANEQLDIAMATYSEWFGEAPATASTSNS